MNFTIGNTQKRAANTIEARDREREYGWRVESVGINRQFWNLQFTIGNTLEKYIYIYGWTIILKLTIGNTESSKMYNSMIA